MESTPENIFDRIQHALKENGASIFANLLYTVPKLYQQNGNYRLIVAPNDNVMNILVKNTGKSINELLKSNTFIDILARHVFDTATNQKKLSEAVNPKVLTIGSTNIWIVNGLLMSKQELNNLMVKRFASQFENLPIDVLFYMINAGQIKGKDVVGLCLGNYAMNERCNKIDKAGETIFDKLLLKEFGIRPPYPDNKTARDYYVEEHSGYILLTNVISLAENTPPYMNREEILSRLVPFLDIKVKHVSCHENYMLFIDNHDVGWAAGNNSYGKLGIGNNYGDDDIFIDPRRGRVPIVTYPTRIKNIPNAKSVSCYREHAAVVDLNGNLWTFGHHGQGQLGVRNLQQLKDKSNNNKPEKVQVIDMYNIPRIQYSSEPILITDMKNVVKALATTNGSYDITIVLTSDNKIYETKGSDGNGWFVDISNGCRKTESTNYRFIDIFPDGGPMVLGELESGEKYISARRDNGPRKLLKVHSDTIDVSILNMYNESILFLRTERGKIFIRKIDDSEHLWEIPNPKKSLSLEEPTLFGIQRRQFDVDIPYMQCSVGVYDVYLLDDAGIIRYIQISYTLESFDSRDSSVLKPIELDAIALLLTKVKYISSGSDFPAMAILLEDQAA